MKNRKSPEPFISAIIGGGLTGTSMLCQLIEGIREALSQGKRLSSAVEIHIIEKNDEFGPGFPHSDRNAMPFHLINMCARDMSILSGTPDDFQSWADENITQLENQFQWKRSMFRTWNNPDPACLHYPRPVMGEYLKTRFRKAVQLAEKMGVTVRLYPGHEVTDLREEMDNRVRMILKHGLSGKEIFLSANCALLATGHWSSEERQPRYFPSPWPATHLEAQIPKGASVAIIGSSLSAIDAVLTLSADGTFERAPSREPVYHASNEPRRLTLYSRSALLPTVRGRTGSYRNKFLTPGGIERLIRQKEELRLLDLFMLLDRDLERAYGRPFSWKKLTDPKLTPKDRLSAHLRDARQGDGPQGEILWQTVLQQVFPMVRRLYLALSPKERMRFNSDFSTLFFSHGAPMPMINAEKLLALMKSGIVTLRRAAPRTLFKEKGSVFSFSFQDHDGKRKHAVHDYVVDARGQGKDFRRNPQRWPPAGHRIWFRLQSGRCPWGA
jgi:uncharacterized NAD(P)/FAD-binding protein YdhS